MSGHEAAATKNPAASKPAGLRCENAGLTLNELHRAFIGRRIEAFLQSSLFGAATVFAHARSSRGFGILAVFGIFILVSP